MTTITSCVHDLLGPEARNRQESGKDDPRNGRDLVKVVIVPDEKNK